MKEGRGPSLTRRDLLLAVGAGAVLTGFGPKEASFPYPHEQYFPLATMLPRQHLALPLPPSDFFRPLVTKKTVDFILSHQLSNGAFITDHDKREVVPMDIGHAGLGLVMAGHTDEAKAGISYALSLLTLKSESKQIITVNDKEEEVNYAGSWWNEYDEDGERKHSAARGRAEQNGLVLMTVDAICRADPSYFTSRVNEELVSEHVWNMVEYLGRIQQKDGRFIHRPTFPLSFPEENVRMAEGLKLMADRFLGIGEIKKAETANDMSNQAFNALKRGAGYTYGMSYDYIARAMWGIDGREVADKEIRHAIAEHKLTPSGVKMFDMQQSNISYFDRQKWKQKMSGEVYEVAGSIEGAIALMAAGWIPEAEAYEREITRLQRPNGGFPTAFLGPISGGRETIFTGGRFLLMERQKTALVHLKEQLGMVD